MPTGTLIQRVERNDVRGIRRGRKARQRIVLTERA